LGDQILKRECNKQQCPKEVGIKERNQTMGIEVRQNRSRIQRYEKCRIKQDDMDVRLKVRGKEDFK
jgi:hypothetical protein